MENISHKIPGSFPKDSDYVSAPSTPRGTRCARVGPPKSGSSESSCDEGTFWGSGKRADSNTSSTRTTPSPPPKRSTKPREESPSPTARRSAPSAGSPGAHSALTDRANLSEATVPAPARGPVERPQHEPYIGQETFAEALEKPPGPLDLEPRQIYVYSIQEYPGLLKVGYTTRGVSAHLDEWRTRCKGNPILRFVYPENAPLLPCVHRVKTLIHIELQECRKQLPPCPACQERHDGWFDIELPELKSTIEFWGRLYQMQTDTLALVLEWRTSYPESYSGVRKRRKAAPTTGKGSRDDSILDHFQPVGKPKPRQSRSPGGEEDTVLAAANNPELAPENPNHHRPDPQTRKIQS
ncbi:MAG: hypothetical protein M1840_001731 [Geoglossum simile]|nr:MAG: hypothetical protein M1840_001731 [Geoglossum simile]